MQWEQLPCQGHLGRLGPGSQAGMQAIWDATSLGVERTDISPPKNIQTPNNKYNKFSKKCRTSDRAAPITETYELA